MFSFPYMPSTTSVLSTYTTLAALLMLLNTAIRQLQNIFNRFVPKTLQDKIISKLEFFMGTLSSTMCIIVNETNGYSNNEVFEAAEIFLRKRISPSVNQFQVFKVAKDKNIMITIEKGEEIVDNFDGIELKWKLVCLGGSHKTKSDSAFAPCENSESRLFQLRFNKEFKEKILNSYLPFVLEISKEIKEQSKVVKLHSLGCPGGKGSVNLDHPSTFDTLAMDPMVKKELIEDLDRFVKRKDFYRRVGKAWKRGYLLYGPPGTGKSSLVAAMANHLKFDIYDLVLGSQGNSDMRRLLTYTKNRSIIVIEDIDCSTDFENREDGRHLTVKEQQLNLSGLLNFIDGLWSSCGDQRIIVFTTNYKERLDPALLRPGRMDMHIHMSYCTFSGFKILASNYLEIKSHRKFDEIERMIDKVEVTPAEIAEELMKSEDVEIALDKVVELLCKKRDQSIGEIKGAIEDDTGEEDEKGAMEKMCSVGTNNNMQVQALQHVIN